MNMTEDLDGSLVDPDGSTDPIDVELVWQTGDPWAVEARFWCGPVPVVWLLGRDLLFDGLAGPIGDGDVRVSPVENSDRVELRLSTPWGHAVIELDNHEVFEFLTCTYDAIPPGEELLRVPIDAELAELMNGSEL